MFPVHFENSRKICCVDQKGMTLAKVSLMARIAVVDDSRDALDIFEIVFRDEHEVETFEDPVTFMDHFSPNRYGLILLDLALPSIDGFEVFRWINDRDADVPVVAVTARAQDAERQKALKAGFCDYFVKPIVEMERFRTAVQAHIGGCANPPYIA